MINPHAMEVGEKRIEDFFQKLHLGENGFNIRKWLFFIKKPHCFSLTYGIRWIRSVSGTPPLFAYGKIDIFPYSLPRFAHHEIAFVHHRRKNRKANEK